MYINIEAFDDLKKLQGGALESIKKKNCIIFIRMNNCQHCDQMKQEWQSLVKDKENDDNINILEIESNRINDLVKRDREFFHPKLTGIRGFPTIMLQNRNREVFPFQGNRSKADFLRFIKAHSNPLVVKKRVVKKHVVKKRVDKEAGDKKPRRGLDEKGKLLPGFIFEKGGKGKVIEVGKD